MLRFAVAFSALVATSAYALSPTPVEHSPNAKVVIDGAFAAIAAASPPVLAYAPITGDTPAEAAAPAPTPKAATPAERPAAPSIVITVDKSTQRMTVTVDGVKRWTWPVSTGRRGHATPAGSFQAFRLERDHYSKEWDDAPMPHSIFFTKRGHAIHGSYDTAPARLAGFRRLRAAHPDNATQLFALVQQHGVLNTTVVIAGADRGTAVYARANDAPRTQSKNRARGPNTQTRSPPQRVVHQTLHQPGYQPPYTRPIQIAPHGFALPAR